MRRFTYLLGLMAMPCQVVAQSTDCITTGSNMVHCNSIGSGEMSSTDCMAMGSNMVHCNTISSGTQAYPDSGTALGKGLATFVARLRENNFRKKVGQMLANGDCVGAANYAYSRGYIEVGSAIQHDCAARSTTSLAAGLVTPTPSARGLYTIANQILVPTRLDTLTTLTHVDVVGTQLIYTIKVDPSVHAVSESQRERFVQGICSADFMKPLMRDGASVRATYHDQSGRPIGMIIVSRRDCGL